MSQENIIGEILVTCMDIDSDRNIHTVLNHLNGEVVELNDAVIDNIGEDGVMGESVDVIICAVDAIYQDNPHITYEEILNKVMEKLAKWKRIYG